MRWILCSPCLLIVAAGTHAFAADAKQLTNSRLERSLEKQSPDGRYQLDSRLAPLVPSQRSGRFELRTELTPKAVTAACAVGGVFFANGFETP